MRTIMVAWSIAVPLAVVPFPAPAWSWTQVVPDIDGESAGDESGFSVALSSTGTRVASSVHLNDGGGTDAGHVRVYHDVITSATPIPTPSQWGILLLTLSLLAIATC